MAAAPPQRANSYDHLSFPLWQVRLLMSSSMSFIVASSAATYFGQTILSILLLIAGLCSLNYWRSPGPSWRRDTDLASAGVALFFCLYTGFWLSGLTCNVAWAALLASLACFRKSWNLSLGHCEVWAVWHAVAHALAGVAAINLASGDVANKGSSVFPPHNLIAECCVAAIVLTVIADVTGISHPAVAESERKEA
jgi:hypothetical protein